MQRVTILPYRFQIYLTPTLPAFGGKALDVFRTPLAEGMYEEGPKHNKTWRNVEIAKGRDVPSWLEFDATALTGKIGKLPSREEVSVPVREQLIVEFMSK